MSDLLLPGLRVGLEVDADLEIALAVDGRPTARAHVVGHGRHVTVAMDDPGAFAVDRRLVGQVADLLADAGLTVSVRGPGGTVARLGAGVSSRVGSRATGSRHTALAPRGAWLVLRTAGRAVPTTTTVALLAAAAAVALTAVAAHGLRHHPWERRA